MFNKFKNWILPFFSLHKREQRGILFLAIIILMLVIVNMIMPWIAGQRGQLDLSDFRNDIETFKQSQQTIHDSLDILEMQNTGRLEKELALQKIKPIEFDPNKLPEEIWLAMGFSQTQVAKIKNYESKGGKFHRKEDVKKMYCISDAEYEIIEPYIQIKSPYQTKPARKTNKKPKTTIHEMIYTEINSANASQLEKNLNINPWLANRIIDYRNLLGGYLLPQQLLEVYGMKPEIFESISPFVTMDTALLKRINLNTITFKDLLRHPYVDYELTKGIINTRNKIGSYQSLNEIQQIPSVSDSIFLILAPYIQINTP